MKSNLIKLVVLLVIFLGGFLSVKKEPGLPKGDDKALARLSTAGLHVDRAENLNATKDRNEEKVEELIEANKQSREGEVLQSLLSQESDKTLYEYLSKSFLKDSGGLSEDELGSYYAKQNENILRNKEEALDFIEDARRKLKDPSLIKYRLSILSLVDSAIQRYPLDEKFVEIAAKEMFEVKVAPRPSIEDAETEEDINQALSTPIEHALPLYAQEIVLKSMNPALVYEATAQGIASQEDEGLRRTLYLTHLEIYPLDKDKLDNRLSSLGVDPPEESPNLSGGV